MAACAGSPQVLASALLIRSNVQASAGDSALANSLAKQARELLRETRDPFLKYTALMAIGATARSRGQRDEALDSLQEALSLAEQAGNPYRRSSALYQLSVALSRPEAGRQGARREPRRRSSTANRPAAPYAMANARMAESAALELLERPERELAAMEEALAIARNGRVADRRRPCAHQSIRHPAAPQRVPRCAWTCRGDRSTSPRRSVIPGWSRPARRTWDSRCSGWAGRSEGKRLADEALAEYERSGATAEIADLLGEYGQYLERAGDYKAALALYHRERKLNDEIALAAHQRAVLEMQEKYEAEKRRREIELLNRENDAQVGRAGDAARCGSASGGCSPACSPSRSS